MKKADSAILFLFASNLKRIRKEQGLSQEDLADRAGLHRTYIGMIERCEKNITLLNIDRIATALRSTVTDLLSKPDQ